MGNSKKGQAEEDPENRPGDEASSSRCSNSSGLRSLNASFTRCKVKYRPHISPTDLPTLDKPPPGFGAFSDLLHDHIQRTVDLKHMDAHCAIPGPFVSKVYLRRPHLHPLNVQFINGVG